MTYEEFLSKFGSDKFMNFDKNAPFMGSALDESPSKYIEVAEKSEKLIITAPPSGNSEFYEELQKLVEASNGDIKICDGAIGYSNKQNYLQGEAIIQKVIEEINPKWNTKQKLAYVHYKMGELISYLPDFNHIKRNINSRTVSDARNAWTSLATGRSVCNGVTAIQRNILSRIGIETEELLSNSHSFMLTKTEEGNIVTDATWDLRSCLYNAKPNFFGVTYEQLQKIDGDLSRAHKLENPPEDVIEISDEELREIYYSIGIANEDRTFKFPILDIVKQVNEQQFNSEQEKTDAFLERFLQSAEGKTIHLEETKTMIGQCINELGVSGKNIKTFFAYQKSDNECDLPQLAIHIGSDESKDQIRILNINQMKFQVMNVSEFDKKYKEHNNANRLPFWQQYLNSQSIQNETQKERAD